MSSSWLGRLRAGLARSSSRLTESVGGIFRAGRRVDAATIAELEDALIEADLGPATAARLAAGLARRRFSGENAVDEVRAALAADIAGILAPVARPLTIGQARPHVVLVVGVNGTGKTTTIGKLARLLAADGHKVMLAAADTFRAAAIEQLQLWGERTGVAVVARQAGADPAAVAWDALERAKAEGIDVLLIDTAGRLHNKANLMAELQKVVRVIRRLDDAAPHDTLLVLDATTGQNAHAQVETFRDLVSVSGLVVTKLDGTARGGVVVALADRFGLPIHAIGVGEGADDLRPFAADAFAAGLLDSRVDDVAEGTE
ncbi:MAG: signal recognition particle-docking protein FtsY [Alphaproteobacteria bacterium]|nr:signal recognition particle-docking protein FtsY [Alphaproteobacteria bacterium]